VPSDAPHELDEARLILLTQRGDHAAFETLYVNHLAMIYRYVFFRVGDEREAEDLTEEVFVRAWESLAKYQSAGTRFASWLYRIAHNLTVDYHRRQMPMSLSDPRLEQLPAADNTERVADHDRTIAALVAAIRQLDDSEQAVVILRFVEGLSHQETAATIGKSLEASRVIQYRALAKLGKALEGEG
jgi:RNA polymerase sigma-70 factor (ECF subfamily)